MQQNDKPGIPAFVFLAGIQACRFAAL